MNLKDIRGFPTLLFFLLTPLPSFADFGSHFEVKARLGSALNSPDKKISFRFTCQEDLNVIALSFYCETAQAPPSYQASLQEDKNGKPSGQIMESASLVPKAGGWITLPLNPVQLTSGKIYHLVIDCDINGGGHHPVEVIGPAHFAAFAYTDPLNPFLPATENADRAANVLFFEKGRWKELNHQPLYALHGAGQKTQGNPYDDFGSRPIHGNGTLKNPSDDVLQGASLHPHAGINPKGILARVRKQGNPKNPLNLRIYSIDYMHHKTTLTYSGEALTPSEISTSFQWVTIGIKKPGSTGSVLFPPECRYVVFQSDSGHPISGTPGCEDCYLLSDVGNSGGLAGAVEMSFDGGPHLSRAVHSTDGWTTWIDEFQRDAHVVILAPVNPSPKIPAIEPLPTPSSLMRSFNP